jgi:hypothetical protein
MQTGHRIVIAIAALAVAAGPAAAQEADRPRPEALNRLMECRSLTDSAQRLACFDREVAAIDAAEAANQLVVVDREQIRKTRRSLFGLSLPDLGIFGGGDDEEEEEEGVSQIESTIKNASRGSYGRWIITLENGAVWAQTDDRNLPRWPKAGHPIVIKRAALGSFMANINDQNAIRVERLR